MEAVVTSRGGKKRNANDKITSCICDTPKKFRQIVQWLCSQWEFRWSIRVAFLFFFIHIDVKGTEIDLDAEKRYAYEAVFRSSSRYDTTSWFLRLELQRDCDYPPSLPK